MRAGSPMNSGDVARKTLLRMYPERRLLAMMPVAALALLGAEAPETASDSPARVVHFEHSQNLAATNPLGCVDANEVAPQSTAADIASGAKACLEAEDYDRLLPLVMMASAYARYDTLRVTDETAHAALSALFADRFAEASDAQVERLMEAGDAFNADADRHGKVCAVLTSLGPPDYRPDYMIAHGMQAFLDDSDEPPVREIDREAAWRTALEFVNCI